MVKLLESELSYIEVLVAQTMRGYITPEEAYSSITLLVCLKNFNFRKHKKEIIKFLEDKRDFYGENFKCNKKDPDGRASHNSLVDKISQGLLKILGRTGKLTNSEYWDKPKKR